MEFPPIKLGDWQTWTGPIEKPADHEEEQEHTGFTLWVYTNPSHAGGRFTQGKPTVKDAPEGENSLTIIRWYGYYVAVPNDNDPSYRHFEGAYVTTSDSRFKSKYPHPIPVHEKSLV